MVVASHCRELSPGVGKGVHWRQAFWRSSSGVARANEDRRMMGSASRECIFAVLGGKKESRRPRDSCDKVIAFLGWKKLMFLNVDFGKRQKKTLSWKGTERYIYSMHASSM
jgi:hypothetical protein